MTKGQVEQLFIQAPKRQIGDKTVFGYFHQELSKHGVPMGKVKKLVRQGFLKEAGFKPEGQNCVLKLYYLEE